MVLGALVLSFLRFAKLFVQSVNPFSFFVPPRVGVFSSFRVVELDIFLHGPGLLICELLSLLAFALELGLFLVEYLRHFHVLHVMLMQVLFLLPHLERVHLLNIRLGSVAFFSPLHVLIVHVPRLLRFDHFKLLGLVHLFLPDFGFLLLKELSTLPLLLLDLGLFLGLSLLLHSCLLCLRQLLLVHACVRLLLPLFDPLRCHLLQALAFSFGA